MKMNKKADIPVTILVIGVFAICALTLLSFYSSLTKVKTSFVSIALIEKMNSQREEFSIYKNLDEIDTITENGKVFFYQEKTRFKFSPSLKDLKWVKRKTLMSVKSPVP